MNLSFSSPIKTQRLISGTEKISNHFKVQQLPKYPKEKIKLTRIIFTLEQTPAHTMKEGPETNSKTIDKKNPDHPSTLPKHKLFTKDREASCV